MLRVLLILAVLAISTLGNAPQHQPSTDLTENQVPDTCEGNSLRLDVVRNKSIAGEADNVTIAIARLGKGEQSRELNRRRLYTVRKYHTAMGLPPEKLVTAEGERARGRYGRVETYIDGLLVDVLAAERGKDLPVGICDDDIEDRNRYQLPRSTHSRKQ